ncbi:MAG: hypothetical protein D6707_00840 [Bacteroidetes bacterium]|nr:MAG: hypothetical protein D6707_00840 [Bacteroidota bacterium]
MKYYSIDFFDFQLLKLFPFLPAAFLPFLSRVLISFEFLLGVLLIIRWFEKTILKITFICLICFIAVNLYQWYAGIEDCGCFGNVWQLSPQNSLIKNIVLLFLTVFLLKSSQQPQKTKIKGFVTLFLAIALLSLSFLLKPVYFSYNKHLFEKTYKFPSESIESWEYLNIHPDKPYLIGFVSTGCPHCKSALQALDKLVETIQLPPVNLVVYGDSAAYDSLQQKLQISHRFDYITDTSDEFFSITGGSVPKFYLIQNDTVYFMWKGEINFDDIDSYRTWKNKLKNFRNKKAKKQE